MDVVVPNEILTKLRCDQCQGYLSCGPVYLRYDEESVCGRCSVPEESAVRNKHYEAVAGLLKFPCKYQEHGCLTKLKFSYDTPLHETVCEYRPLVCPILESGSCEWIGQRKNLLEHCRSEHSNRLVETSCSLTYDITRSSQKNFLLVAFNVLFLLHTKVCITARKIYHSVRYLGNPEKAQNFTYKLDIKRRDNVVSKTNRVATEGCRTIQEDTSIATDINGLLAVLEGFDGTVFVISVQKVILCAVGCGANVTQFIYREANGWWCERCAPIRRTCKNKSKGCAYIDIDVKCKKHEEYYCQYGSYCYLCRTYYILGPTLTEHCDLAHSNILHKSGINWLIAKDNKTCGHWCIISTDSGIGNAFCAYWFINSKFELNVRTAIPTDQLCKYSCTVQLTDPRTRHKTIRTLDYLYREKCDWKILIKTEELQSNSKEFEIKISIVKK